MNDVKGLFIDDGDEYTPSASKLETAQQSVICYDDIMEDDEAAEFDEITRQHYMDTLDYERKQCNFS